MLFDQETGMRIGAVPQYRHVVPIRDMDNALVIEEVAGEDWKGLQLFQSSRRELREQRHLAVNLDVQGVLHLNETLRKWISTCEFDRYITTPFKLREQVPTRNGPPLHIWELPSPFYRYEKDVVGKLQCIPEWVLHFDCQLGANRVHFSMDVPNARDAFNVVVGWFFTVPSHTGSERKTA